jgi:perosamine synthetase
MKKIQYVSPSIGDLEIEYVNDAIRTGWGSKCYDYINRFERDFAEFHQVSHAHATSSCTGALHLGLAALGVGPGDEVILAETNWVATLSPIIHLGANPVLVDIDPSSWCIDPERIKEAITPKTKAVIATHIYGNLCDLDAISTICEEHGLYLIEDAAEAFGAKYKGRLAGSIGVFSVFSFHGTKTMTTGEGGMFLTNNNDLYELVCTLNNHGRTKYQTKQFWPDMIGYKFKMSNIQAALGLAQLHRSHELIERKQLTFKTYRSLLGSSFQMNQDLDDHIKPSYWMPTIIVESSTQKELIIKKLVEHNIDARTFFWPLSLIFPRLYSHSSKHAQSSADRGINLPSPYDISVADIELIVELIKNGNKSWPK